MMRAVMRVVASLRRRARACRRRRRRRCRGRGRAARMGDDGGDDEREAGFGMTHARVTYARDTGARDDARGDAHRRFIEATRARMPPPSRRRRRRRRARARVGDDGGGTTRGKRGFGMTRVRVTHAGVSQASEHASTTKRRLNHPTASVARARSEAWRGRQGGCPKKRGKLPASGERPRSRADRETWSCAAVKTCSVRGTRKKTRVRYLDGCVVCVAHRANFTHTHVDKNI